MADRDNTTMLGSLVLSPHLAIRQSVETGHVTWEDKRTIGGQLVSRYATATKGRKLQLDGEGNHFTVSQIAAIRQMMDAAQPVLLQHHRYTGMVRIDAVSSYALPLDPADFTGDDWVSATIDLTEV